MHGSRVEVAAVLFDLGQVLVRFARRAESVLAESSSLGPDAFLSWIHRSGCAYQYETGRLTTAAFHSRLSSEGGVEMSYPEFIERWCSIFDPEPVLPRRFLESLRTGRPLVLVSNTNEAHAEFIRRRYDLFDCFDRVILSYEVGALKPEPGIFREALRAISCAPGAALFIDDQEANVAGAAEIGLQVHHFQSPETLFQRLEALGVAFEWPGAQPV